jgi:erythromycin esterase-like protein
MNFREALKMGSKNLIEVIKKHAQVCEKAVHDYDYMLQSIGNASVVMIGEASHGTHDFYRQRAIITKRLIEEKGFTAVTVEGDWPDCYRVNKYVQGMSTDKNASEAMEDFSRFPTWMWRNADVLDFVGWLRDHNDKVEANGQGKKCGFYGLDLYSMYASMECVRDYLENVDPTAARRARDRYACFDRYDDPQEYGAATGLGLKKTCENEVVQQLIDLQKNKTKYCTVDGGIPEDEYFFAEINAKIVKNAERYYRATYQGGVNTWDLRDTHMVETLEDIVKHLNRYTSAGRAKVVVWAHNSHLGDARATEAKRRKELNIGQLVRERWGNDCFNVGFTSFTGTVTAADNWDEPEKRKWVRPGMEGSWEKLFHEVGIDFFMLHFRAKPELMSALAGKKLLERAIGVIYRPDTERWSHYFDCDIARQFDCVIHIDETRAVEPLVRSQRWVKGEQGTPDLPETFPTGL